MKYECLYSDIKAAVGDFRHSEDALEKAVLIAGQCKFAAAGFMLASSKAFDAYCKLDMERLEKYRDIALAVTENVHCKRNNYSVYPSSNLFLSFSRAFFSIREI